MSLSTESTEGQPAPPPVARGAAVPPGPAASLLVGAAADRCAVCDAQLAVDQRYCVECGTRRGNPRFTLARSAPAAPATSGGALGRAAGAAITRLQLLLALLTVLVAVGVGVLIGHGTTAAPKVAPTGATTHASASTTTSASTGSAKGTSAGGGASSGNLFSSGG